ncbi:hypothetical protein [Actinoplanes xinjiangensis]|uniref:hypothetical protein n=1 Tax=Actinoplanes xinjiangensis TaxID=512350 RepID=UPI0011B56C16|nr:hypothetical protein [Actinoplanes xinjiangensis]GIF37460.1 hypothetical protein Axi01nite_17710 [Actinoplanes xinjiangensis]
MRWPEYADLARQLADARSQEEARSTQVRQRALTGRAEVDKLKRRLNVQGEHLPALAQRLREPHPSFGGTARTGLNDVDEALRRAWDAVNQADVEARKAEERGMRPALFPTMSPVGRNALIYSVAAFCTWLVACGLFILAPSDGASAGTLLWSMCGLPAIAYFAAYIVISVFGRPRAQSLGDVEHSARLGGLICFGGSFLAWILVLAVTALI